MRGAPLVVGVAGRRTRPSPRPRRGRAIHAIGTSRAISPHPRRVKRSRAAVARLPAAPLLVVHAAAAVRSDVLPDGAVDFAAWEEVTRTAVDGLGHVLRARPTPPPGSRRRAGRHLVVSRPSCLRCSIHTSRIRRRKPISTPPCDRSVWRGRVRVVTIHLGHVGGTDDGWRSRLTRPTYRAAARVLDVLGRPRVPDPIGYPWPYRVVSDYLRPLCPDAFYARALRAIAGRRGR